MKEKSWSYDTGCDIEVFDDKIVVTGFGTTPTEIPVGSSKTFRWGTQFKYNTKTQRVEVFDPEGNKVGEAPINKIVNTGKVMTVSYH